MEEEKIVAPKKTEEPLKITVGQIKEIFDIISFNPDNSHYGLNKNMTRRIGLILAVFNTMPTRDDLGNIKLVYDETDETNTLNLVSGLLKLAEKKGGNIRSFTLNRSRQ